MSRVLGIDYGTKYIGLALSDKDKKMAFPLEIIENKLNKIKKEIQSLIKEKDISEIVIGLPKDAKGEPNELTKKVLNFSEKLKKEFSLPVYFIDERFTSAEIRKLYAGKKIATHAKAACLILDSFLSRLKIKN